MDERRIFGGPGTGKTTRLATQDIPNAVDKFGPDKVLVTSFSKAAARELSTKKSVNTQKKIEVNPSMVGTIHSICYHALGMPTLVTEQIDQWNSQYPHYALSGSSLGNVDATNKSSSSDIQFGNTNPGEDIFNELNILRAKMIDQQSWAPNIQDFNTKWKEFKDETNTYDFTDLIEGCLTDKPFAPNRPDVIFLDEAQDSTILSLSLLRSWAMMTKWMIVIGDDDQCIYSFAGCTPDAMLSPDIDEDKKIILKQSYRLPRAVHAYAQTLIKNVSYRQDKNYLPRDEEGVVRRIDSNYNEPDDLINDAKKQLENDKTVMILASCDYMLNELKRRLRDNGLPFHNPYRLQRGDWNPIRIGGKGVNAADIITNFVESGPDGYWSVFQFVKWAKFLKVGNLGLKRKVGKEGIAMLEDAIENHAEGLHTTKNVLEQLLSPDAVEPALNKNLDWLYENVLAMKQKAMNYPLKIYQQQGIGYLKKIPQIIIGTIHSVKGGEADCVYVYPDLSASAVKEMNESINVLDSVYRLFYVAVTRAREEVILCDPVARRGSRKASYAIEL